MNTTAERLVDDYLARLDAALAGVPGERRREIVEEIEAHLAAAVEASPGDEIALREAIDRLGEPEEIAAEARERVPVQVAAPRRGWLETAAILLLLFGGFIGGFGWLVGVALLWMSSVWRVRDKLIGTLFVPGGLALAGFLLVFVGVGSGESCDLPLNTSTGAPSTAPPTCTEIGATPLWQQILLWIGLALVAVLPIATAVYLARRSRPRIA